MGKILFEWILNSEWEGVAESFWFGVCEPRRGFDKGLRDLLT